MSLLDRVQSMERVRSSQPLGLVTLRAIGIVACQEQDFILAMLPKSDPEVIEEKKHDEQPSATTATLDLAQSSQASDRDIEMAELCRGQEKIHETQRRQGEDIRVRLQGGQDIITLL